MFSSWRVPFEAAGAHSGSHVLFVSEVPHSSSHVLLLCCLFLNVFLNGCLAVFECFKCIVECVLNVWFGCRCLFCVECL